MNDTSAPNDSATPTQPSPIKTPTIISGVSVPNKEVEIKISPTQQEPSIVELEPGFELDKEMEQAGVEHFKDTPELPPDVQKLGVTAIPASQTIAQPPLVTLPISDKKIVVGLHQDVTLAIRWLAVFCLKQLRKVGLTLKVIHGKITRVKIN